MANPEKKRKIKNGKKVSKRVIPITKKIGFFIRFRKILLVSYTSIGVVVTLVSWYLLTDPIREKVISQQQLWEEKNYIKGIHIPLKLNSTLGYIAFTIGNNVQSLSLNKLEKGTIIDISKFWNNMKITAKVERNQLYISTVFRDIRTGNMIGKMNFNKWELRSTGINHFHDADNNLEVIDQNGYVVFSLHYRPEMNNAVLTGYFMDDNKIWVLNQEGACFFSYENKAQAIKEIEKIIPFNTY